MGCLDCIEKGKLKNKLIDEAIKLAKSKNTDMAVYYSDTEILSIETLEKVQEKKYKIHSVYSPNA